MPLYEYYCEKSDKAFEALRPLKEADGAAPCPKCGRDAGRIMSSFNAFTFRDGYPRRLPDKGTYWHMGKEVKKLAKRMHWYDHPETTEPKPAPPPPPPPQGSPPPPRAGGPPRGDRSSSARGGPPAGGVVRGPPKRPRGGC